MWEGRLGQSVVVLSRRGVGSGFWGPNAGMRPGTFFVGTRPHPMKYYGLLDKKPNQRYGIQGTNHLLPLKGSIYAQRPVKVQLRKDKVYVWCNCGFSNRQPFCDGSHDRRGVSTQLRPVRFIPDRDMSVWFCQCKQSANRPFCDGSHAHIEGEQEFSQEDIRGTDPS